MPAVEPDQRISGPAELVQAIPYLVGFHPTRSLVLVGLAHGRLVVTARLDLADAGTPGVVHQTVAAIHRGGARELVGAVYDEPGLRHDDDAHADPRIGRLEFLDLVADAGAAVGCAVLDVLLVVAGRWWSMSCTTRSCCPAGGRPVPAQPSAFAAAATFSGRVALADRGELERSLDPLPDAERMQLDAALAGQENVAVQAVLDGSAARLDRSRKRALFAAARASEHPQWPGLGDEDVARFGVALTHIPIRDSVWMAIDDQRLDGRPLWRELARRLPSPYDPPPLFLFGWGTWRAGEGALAGIAADRAVASDPGYSAADLLSAALARGVDPRSLPKLRLPRSA